MKAALCAGCCRSTDVFIRAYSSVILLSILVLHSSNAVASESVGTDVVTNSILLQYRETPFSMVSWGFNLSREAKSYAIEPDTGGRNVIRGSLNLRGAAPKDVPCLWDYREGKLYLDLNFNGDLTDDTNGSFTTKVSSFTHTMQTFKDVRLRFKTEAGMASLCVDLHLYRYGAASAPIYVNATCKSLYEGRLNLGGKDYQVARLAGDAAGTGRSGSSYLLLRAWEERDKPFEVQSGILDAFSFPEQLFFHGQAFAVDCKLVEQEGTAAYQLTLRKRETPLRELKLTGKFIRRMVLGSDKGNFTVVLDSPGDIVQVPPGHYRNVAVQLQSGEKVAYRLSTTSVHVPEQGEEAPVLAVGGPLTNSVITQRRGRQLSLTYELLGADSSRYMVVDQNRAAPPQFQISRGGKEIHSGKFEYG